MAKYVIESLQYGIGEGDYVCGTFLGAIVAEAKIKADSGETFFWALAEWDGIPNFYKAPESLFSLLTKDDPEDEEIEFFNGYCQDTGDYSEIYKQQDPEWFQLYRCLIYLVRSKDEVCKPFADSVIGKAIDEITVPASDIEDFLTEE